MSDDSENRMTRELATFYAGCLARELQSETMYRQQRKHRVDSDGIIRTETKWESSLPDIRRKVEDDQQPLRR